MIIIIRSQEEHRGTCGYDVRPMLPVLLVGSTIVGFPPYYNDYY